MTDVVRGTEFVLRVRGRITAVMREPSEVLNHLFIEVTEAHAAEKITDDQAQSLFEAIQGRRDRQSREGEPLGATLPSIKLPVPDSEPKAVQAPDSEFQIAERERRQKRIGRRRYLSAVCSMPAKFKELFSVSEQAVLSQVVVRCADHGRCDLAVAAIAARANVAERTVQSTIRKAERLRLLSVKYRRRMTSILTVASKLWRQWIKNAPSRTENQKCLILEESMDPLQGAISGTLTVSKEAKAPSKLDHSEPAMSGKVDVLEVPSPVPLPKPVVRAATPSVEDRLAAACALVQEAAKSRTMSDPGDSDCPKSQTWMTNRDRSWLNDWRAVERLDPNRHPNVLTHKGAVRTEVLDWLATRWGSAGVRYSIHRFVGGRRAETCIGFSLRTMMAEFEYQWGGMGANSPSSAHG